MLQDLQQLFVNGRLVILNVSSQIIVADERESAE